jgi:hypothetical protein
LTVFTFISKQITYEMKLPDIRVILLLLLSTLLNLFTLSSTGSNKDTEYKEKIKLMVFGEFSDYLNLNFIPKLIIAWVNKLKKKNVRESNTKKFFYINLSCKRLTKYAICALMVNFQ